MCPASSSARVTMPTGLVKSMIQAAGLARRTCSAIESTTGTVRSALANPPAPVVSWPTQPHSSGQLVLVAGALAADPQLQQHGVRVRHAGGQVAGGADLGRVALLGEDPPGQAADQLQPLGGRVDQHQLGDRQPVAQPGEAVDQFGCVGGAAADDREFQRHQPLTPVRVTPSMKAFCAKKKRTMTGAITSSVAAMVRFQLVWCAPLNDSRP